MEHPPISTVLLGRDTSINNTIIDLLADEPGIEIRHWQTEGGDQKTEATSSPIEVLIADLTSVSGSPSCYLKYLAGKQIYNSILAMHVYTSRLVIDMLLEAGAAGYLTVVAGPQTLIQAVKTVYRGERFVWTDNNEVGEKA